jgi:stage III sporulation protein SpoIIIAA
MLLTKDLNRLLDILPKFISTQLKNHSKENQLIEIVLDIGRRPEARFANGSSYLSYRKIVWQDLDYILKRLGKFSEDNRAGIEKTLHRISSLRNRQGNVIGLTCRIGRALFGNGSIIRDLLENEQSILILGRPGVGKTTAIREIARILSEGRKKRVIIIDTSNEIAGDGDLPHPSIGKSRRMQVSSPQNQHKVMIEAVENHMPEVIIIDEIGTELEATATRTIAERGVQLIGTAHGNTLQNLVKNPTITDLIGGIQYVTLGDEEAKRRGSSKSILERKGPPTFDVAIEIHDSKTWIVHESVEQSVDRLLQGKPVLLQKRTMQNQQANNIQCQILFGQTDFQNSFDSSINKKTGAKRQKNNNTIEKITKIKTKKYQERSLALTKKIKTNRVALYIYGLNNQVLRSLIKMLNLPIILTKEIHSTDKILALASLIKTNKKLRQIANIKNISIYTIENNGLVQISQALRLLSRQKSTNSKGKRKLIAQSPKKKFKNTKLFSKDVLTPLEETRLIIEEVVIPRSISIDLLPQPSIIRKLQHELIMHYNLNAITVGQSTKCRLRIFPKNENK